MACDRELPKNQRVTGISTDEAGEQKFFSISQHKSDCVRKNQQSSFFFDEANDAVRNLNLRTVTEYCLVVERRVEVNGFLGYVEHALNQDVRTGCTDVVFKYWLALLFQLKLVFNEILPRRFWYIILIIIKFLRI